MLREGVASQRRKVAHAPNGVVRGCSRPLWRRREALRMPLLPALGLLALSLSLAPLVAASEDARPDPLHTPTPVRGEGRDVVDPGSLPLPLPLDTVAGLVVTMNASLVTHYDGDDKDVLTVDIAGQGPLRFALPRWNQGDWAPRLGPRRPFSQDNLARLIDWEGSRKESPHDVATQAWRPSIQKGVVMGSVAQNGQKWNDTTPFFYGTMACVIDSHGYGYSMDDGTFGNHNPNIDIAIGKLGGMMEANIDAAVAWFPYAQGWVGGYVDTPGEYSAAKAQNKWTKAWSFSPRLDSDASRTVAWDEEGATLTLPGVDARTDGMLFLTSTNPNPGNNDLNSVSTYIDGRRWRVQVREDDQPLPLVFCLPDQAMFAFIYVPYHAGGLVGGHVDGSVGRPRVKRGRFSVVRISQGVYQLTIDRGPGLGVFQEVQPLSNRDGMLLLQVEGREASHPKFTRHCVLSYSILPNGTLQVESHRLIKTAGGQEEYPAVDTDFYFAWVDFRTPLTPTPRTYTGRMDGAHVGEGSSFLSGFVQGTIISGVLLPLLGLGLLLLSRLSLRRSALAMAPLPDAGADADPDSLGPSLDQGGDAEGRSASGLPSFLHSLIPRKLSEAGTDAGGLPQGLQDAAAPVPSTATAGVLV